MDEPLLDPAFVERLLALSVLSPGRTAGRFRGERRSLKRGAGQEFADFREYTPGDDFRRVDWAAYARLENLYLRLFLEEEDLCVDLLVDRSASMGAADPSKLRWALKAAAGLGIMALAASDGVRLSFLSGVPGPMLRGRPAVSRLLRELSAASAEGPTDLTGSVRRFLAHRKSGRKGVCFLISDLWDGAGAGHPHPGPGVEPALRALVADKRQPRVIHVLSPQELDPWALQGVSTRDLLLVDSETDRELPVSLNTAIRAQYLETLQSMLDRTQTLCRHLGVPYVRVSSDFPLEDAILSGFRQAGMVG